MGFGYSAQNETVIKEEKLAEICEKSFKDFMDFANSQEDSTLDCFSRAFMMDEVYEIEQSDEYSKLFSILQKDFNSYTGLELGISFHSSSENGSRYDEVDGTFFTVGGVWMMTPNAQKAYDNGLINEAWYVVAG